MTKLTKTIIEKIEHVDLVRYAGASGDFNPLHTVSHLAQKEGFPDVIAHGMYLMGLGSKLLEEWFPTQRIKQYKVRFVSPTFVEEELTIIGILEEDNDKKGSIKITNSKGEKKLMGSFELASCQA